MPNKVWWKLNKYHCEKTTFGVAFALMFIGISAYYAIVKTSTWLGNDFVWLFGLSAIAGEIGILWYRKEGKKSLYPALILIKATIVIFIFLPLFTPDVQIACISEQCKVPLQSIFDMITQNY